MKGSSDYDGHGRHAGYAKAKRQAKKRVLRRKGKRALRWDAESRRMR